MYTNFHGTNGQTAARLLRPFKHELPLVLEANPSSWLECIYSLLKGDAAHWADQNPKFKKLLTDENVENATQGDVDTLKALLLERCCPDTRNIEDIQINTMSKMENFGMGT